jgi:hypothetical protein
MLRTRLRSLLTLPFLALAFATMPLVGPAHTVAAASGVTAAAATPSFTVTVDPLSQTRKRGTGAPYFVTINCLNGFHSGVILGLSGNIPPNGVVSTLDPTGCGPLNDGEVDIQILKHTFVTGTFKMTIHAMSGGFDHTVPISLTIV